ncbi:MAG: hypothetical protein Q8L87_16310 [Anaerolineales bacterium]|jgi:hypothetical protein|nr:hypothetical protein [Anaerolineales bacterium]
MKITHGVDEYFHKNFILTEDGLKEFSKTLENAAQRFPAPAEVLYTVLTSDFRYFETARIEDVLHDPDAQEKGILQLSMEADFVEDLPRIEGDVIHKGTRDNWNIRLMFSLRRRGFWDAAQDKITLKVTSEERKWAYDYIDRFEEQIYKLQPGNRTPVMLLWLFVIPLFLLIYAYLTQHGQNPTWLEGAISRYTYYAITLFSTLMALGGMAVSIFKFNPQGMRILFGPMSGFLWGVGMEEYELFEKFRHSVLWVIGIIFLAIVFASAAIAI